MSKLSEVHIAAAEHHVTMAKCHGAMAKADGMEDSAKDFHSTCRDSHTKMAEAYLKCMKADESEFGKKDATPTSLTFDVDPEFRKLVEIDESEQNAW
jgi:hypothetical protein